MSSPSNYCSSIFGPRRNTLTSTWDVLFDKNSKEWIGFKPALGLHVYPCYSCRHMFSSKISFQDHVNRRVMVLKYNCAHCSNQILTFYNRCSFLLHTRKHYTLNRGQINLCELDIFTLPVSLAGFLPHGNIPFLFDEDEIAVPEDTYLNAQFYSPDFNQRGQQIITLKPNDLVFRHSQQSLALKQICTNIPKCEFVTTEYQQRLRKQNLFAESNELNNNSPPNIKQEIPAEPEPLPTMKLPIITKVESLQEKMFKLPCCLECKTYQKGTMAEHYLGENRPFDNSLRCSICRFVASTRCSLKAHIRIHESLPPYVCPDCGKDFQNSMLLSRHMDEVCFHLAKHVRFRCPGKKCGKLFAMTMTFASHFKVHLKDIFTCTVCNNVFFKTEETEAHRMIHNGNCSFKKIYDCTLCTQSGRLTEENYKEHIDMHTTDTNRCMYVYFCKYCRGYFRSTTTFATHLVKCSTKQATNNSSQKSDTSKYITGNCQKCTNKIIFHESKLIKVCNKCKTQAVYSRTDANRKHFCILCSKQIPLYKKCSHVKECKYGTAIVRIPKLTVDDIENKSFSSNSSDLDSMSSPTRSERRRRHNRNLDSSNDDISKKKRRRYTYINNNKPRKDRGPEPDLTADEPVQFNGTYHCKMCNYESTNRNQFHDHIKAHRDISTAYQCMECAECFVVKPSLIKHLLHFHNIWDHETYLKENDCYDAEAVKQLEDLIRLPPGQSKEPVKENQCRVCREEFDDTPTLNKHFRIHGMAFLLKSIK